MAIQGKRIPFGNKRQYAGYLAWPEKATEPLPAVMVLPEIWGVDDHIEDVTRRFAAAGYVAFAPDLFVEEGERPPMLARDRVAEVQAFINENGFAVLMDETARTAALSKKSESVRHRIQETMKTLFAGLSSGGINLEKYIPLCLEASRFLRQECPQSKGQKVASVGYCMGGGLAALLACKDPTLAGAVIYYGNAPGEDQLTQVSCPIIGFYGGLDERVNAGIPAFEKSMKKLGKSFEYRIYPEAQHAFFNDGRPSYNAQAARDSFVRTLEFLKNTLSS